ncbi:MULTISPECIES: hypothetical protein [Halopenitus]|uniref:PaaD zinc beta ribbon domain-containing protein n=1 Tax=Halopenitus malekzadehii TaxID=1267564 RepID=A0A1H6IRN5_9EURY|nr:MULTISPECIES: hypothetical protein [Halopenitus]SEH51493.1 hypothetical protein SAMN05192561_10410 [Halopenitus malekzadehii]
MTVASEGRTGGEVDPDVEGAESDVEDAADAAAETDRDADEPTVGCPFCDSTDVEQESQFGSEISKSQYYCNGCHTVFERIKYDGKRPDTS